MTRIHSFWPALNRSSGPGKVPLIVTDGRIVHPTDILVRDITRTVVGAHGAGGLEVFEGSARRKC